MVPPAMASRQPGCMGDAAHTVWLALAGNASGGALVLLRRTREDEPWTFPFVGWSPMRADAEAEARVVAALGLVDSGGVSLIGRQLNGDPVRWPYGFS